MNTKYFWLVFLITLYFYISHVFAYWFPGIVRFANIPCTTLEGFIGTCLRRRQCQDSAGVTSGVCGNGIGGCCLYQGTCGSSSSNNNTYFINPGFPGTDTTASLCTFTIVPSSANICQIRLDFLAFSLAQPDGNGVCVFDAMTITGSASTVPVICGENSGQHMYLMVDRTNPIQVSLTISSLTSFSRAFNIRATQIACDCPTLAPPGCLQYYTDQSATVTSFNYGAGLNPNTIMDMMTGMMVAGGRQIANTNYGICVGMLPGFCSIQWAQSADATSFTVTGDTAAVAVNPGLPNGAVVGALCTTDYVVIPDPFYPTGVAVGADRFCGNQFLTVITSSKPFVLNVVTDGDEMPDRANSGFSLTYTQLPCSTSADILRLG